eukprot:g841.t1
MPTMLSGYVVFEEASEPRVRFQIAAVRISILSVQWYEELTKAAHHYQEAFQLQPLNAEAESRAGILLAQLGRYAEAEQLLASSLAQERRADVLYSQSEALQADADIVAISQGKSGATGHFDEISSAPSSAAELRRVLTQVCQCRGEFHAKASCTGDAEERLLRLAGEAPLELWLQLPEELRQVTSKDDARPHAEIADGFLPRGQLLKLRILENKRFLSEAFSNWTGSFNNTCFVKGSQALVSSWMLPGQGQHLLQQQRGLCNELLQRSQGQRQMVIKPTNLAFGAGATLWNLSEDAQLTQESCLLSLQEMFQKVQEGISTNLDDVIVQEFVHSLTMKGRKLELRAHVLVASTNPLIVLWDPNVRRGLAIILESLLEVTGGNLTWPTDLANSWEIMGVDFTISGPLSEVSLKHRLQIAGIKQQRQQQQQHITASLAISMAAAPAYVCEFSFQLRNCFDPRKDNVLSQRLLPDVGRDSQGPYSWQHECLDNTFKDGWWVDNVMSDRALQTRANST